jgi:predicted Rossmann-fold nucleotide-binding protein
MHERKRLMAEHADAFLALPGGIGTFEEFFEVWTWRQLGYHDKPVGLLNQNGYYDLLVTFLQSTVTQGFMGKWQMGLIRIGDQAEDLLRELVQAGRSGARVPPGPDLRARRRPPLRTNPLRRRFRSLRRCGCAPRVPQR